MDVAGAEEDHAEGDEEMPHLDEEVEDTDELHHDEDINGEEEDAGELEPQYPLEGGDDENHTTEEHHDNDEGGGAEHDHVDDDDDEGVEEEEPCNEEGLGSGGDGEGTHHNEGGEEAMDDEEEEEYEVPPPQHEAFSDEEDTAVENESSNTLHNNNNQRKRTASQSSLEDGPRRKQIRSSGSVSGKHDTYCWVCHKDGVQAFCKICPRSYHSKCMHVPDEASKGTQQQSEASAVIKTCICPECTIVMNAENLETRSETMKKLTVDQLIIMLKYACMRMQNTPGAEPFLYPVDPNDAVDYFQYIVYPMDLTTLENNVKKRQYGSTEAFLADAQWLVHNSVVFNSATSPFTAIAKKILKVCRQEIQDIETCPECYVNAHNKPEVWFVQACKRPHILVWAKLKGFPFWPAKAMKVKDEMVDVRFFGAHDRAWVVRKDCFLYSEENPSAAPPKRNAALLASIEELNTHMDKLKELHGPVVFPTEKKTPIGPLSVEEIRKMLPEYQPDKFYPKTPTSSAGSGGMGTQPAKKSPMTIRISSLKTNPTIVTNSVVEESGGKSKLGIKNPEDNEGEGNDGEEEEEEKHENDDEQQQEQEEEQQQSSGEENETGGGVVNEPTPKPTGILANALATGRPTRRSSRSETGSVSPATSGGGDQRMLRAVLRPDNNTESGDDSSSNKEHHNNRDSTPPPPTSFLKSLGLTMKGSEVIKKKPTSMPSQLGKLLQHQNEAFVKEEQDDYDDQEYGETNSGNQHQQQHYRKPNEMINHPGMRFNLSKDISISPVADDSGEDNNNQHHHYHHSQMPQRRMIQGQGRLVPGLIPQQNMQMIGGRPRQMMNSGGMQQQRLQQQLQQQRIGGGMMRPRPGVPLRPGMRMNGPRPQQMMQMKTQQQLQGQQKSNDQQGGFSNAVQMNQIHSIQGGVTLPGGTITVTPLQPVLGIDGSLNGGQVVVKQNITTSNGGLPMSVMSPHDGSQSLLKSNNKPSPQRRNLMNQVPSSVGHLVQNLQKTLVENVKSTMEQIVVEMIEKVNSSGSGTEVKGLKEENERLKKQVLEYKHNQDAMTREIKESLLADKKRSMTELRKQLEVEKNKAVEEAKKKQWCARCGREAQFYCCWNTSYCGYSCQEDHWPSHMNSCSQSTGGGRQ